MYTLYVYNACMNSIQYTIRNIPEPVDKILRQKAHEQGKSFNKTVVETLEQATVKPKTVAEDLDWFIGKNDLGKGFDEAIERLNNFPNDLDDNFRV